MMDKVFSKIGARIGVTFLLLLFASPVFAAQGTAPGIPCDIFPTAPGCPPFIDVPRNPVVLIPGILTSYNKRVLYDDKDGGTWRFVPLGNVYQGLIIRLRAAGYTDNQDLFIAYYDWRKSSVDSAGDYLAPIIKTALEHSTTGKVDLVAHSMGGLVAQAYINSDQYVPGEIDHLVMLGTPNAGASDAYLPWEGGILPSGWSPVAKWYVSNIEQSLRKERNVKDVIPVTYRAFFPSLGELLPTGNFLTKNGNSIAGVAHNDFLSALHDAYDSLFHASGISITTIAGNNEQTLNSIALNGFRTREDIALDRWRDGHPQQEVPSPNDSAGDATVLTQSALLGQNDIVLDNVSHTDLPEKAQNQVLVALGITDDHPEQFVYQAPQSITGFTVLSPVDIVVTDASGKTVSRDVNDFGDDAFVDIDSDINSDDPKIIMLQNLPQGTYTVHLTGTGTGPYTVVTTHADETTTESKTLGGTTVPGKKEFFTITIGDDGADVSKIKRDGPDDDDDDRGQHNGKHHPKGSDKHKNPPKNYGHKRPTLDDLKPLNDTFFSVYHRLPTLQEWKYWASRYENDKPDWKQLYGAMCWQFARR